jgi:hypothetical protein
MLPIVVHQSQNDQYLTLKFQQVMQLVSRDQEENS